MEIDNDLVKNNSTIIKNELRDFNTQIVKLQNILQGYNTIEEIEENIPNNEGGYDKIKKIPNHRNLSKTLLTQEREITYTDCNEKFQNRNK